MKFPKHPSWLTAATAILGAKVEAMSQNDVLAEMLRLSMLRGRKHVCLSFDAQEYLYDHCGLYVLPNPEFSGSFTIKRVSPATVRLHKLRMRELDLVLRQSAHSSKFTVPKNPT